MADSRVIVNLEGITNSCFVVMPFHSLFEPQYERVIRPAVEDAGLECVRGDEIYTQQAIVQDIWKSIRQARVILAELSGRNPNVMYETGLAHAIGKPIVFITRSQEDVPFDLRTLRYIYYDPNNPFWGEDLRVDLTKMIRKVIEESSITKHLSDIEVRTVLPDIPKQPATRQEELPQIDFSGVWNSSWLSIRRQREHKATLVIPADHGSHFMASMTVTYERHEQQTIVQETLTGNVRDSQLSLTGVNYTYVEKGSSGSYSLDSFELSLSDNNKSLNGQVVLRHGTCDIVFSRLSEK
ncbi:MAG: hypothetical protein GY797_04655 [Deltaproteobacteria bacterium]|nr:hypothetical protein [Deltaproteobacteria bacterium]